MRESRGRNGGKRVEGKELRERNQRKWVGEGDEEKE